MLAIKALPELPLTEVLDLALQAGLLVHLSGGDTDRAADTMRRIALALGAVRADTVVSSLNIGMTIERGNERDTAFRRAPHVGANFANLSAIQRVLDELEAGQLDAEALRNALDHIARRKPFHSRTLMALLIGFSCGAFAALFGGDFAAVLITTVGGALGVAVRFLLLAHGFKPVVFAICASFTALLVVGLLRSYTATPDAALAASVLFLIPGVPLINGASDMLAANYLNGMVRLTMSAMIVIGIAIGVSIALRFLG